MIVMIISPPDFVEDWTFPFENCFMNIIVMIFPGK